MKKFALYLPQFHEFKENNDWWGEGFTEWKNVTEAKPLFTGHIQPKEPLNNNYYNLMDSETVKWQTKLANQYGIDGFIYYHYYFQGKLLMNRPAENLLKMKEIKQNFFFCWANHSWFKGKGKDRIQLIEQRYGDQKDWEAHFSYLLPFFKDDRYQKVNNKPMFMLYNANFSEKKELFDFFNQRCRDEVFDGLYLIETFSEEPTKDKIDKFTKCLSNQTETIYIREPNASTSVYYKKKPLKRLADKLKREYKLPILKRTVPIIQGDSLYSIMLQYRFEETITKKVAHGVFFEWDNTPRHKSNGYVITAVTKELFSKYYHAISDDEFIVINAWNEWAEGMMLEPTKTDGYKYLEWLKEE